MRARATIVVAAALAALLTASCRGDEAAAPAPAAATPSPAATGEGGSVAYESLEAAAAAFDCEDVQDVGTGGNRGLDAFGVCHLGRANVDIYLTSERGLWEHIAQQYPSVLGPNWIIVAPTGAKVARTVHERIGGELVIPGG